MTYLLDTDTINYLLKSIGPVPESYQAALQRGAEFVLCPVVDYQIRRYHLLRGLTGLARRYAETVEEWRRADFTESHWDLAGELWAERHRIGKPIEDADLLIAVTARLSGAVLVTNNVRHFQELGLTVENWRSP
jgi:tRNA(fMet)-specific endonuclease VapC